MSLTRTSSEAIAGIIVGLIVFILLILSIVIFLVHYNRKETSKSISSSMNNVPISSKDTDAIYVSQVKLEKIATNEENDEML